MSWHRQYRGKSVGRVLHFLYHYCGFNVEEYAEVGENTVSMYGKQIATYDFLSDTDIPHFEFVGENAADYTSNQSRFIFAAIKDADDAKPEPCCECKSLKLELGIYKAFHSSAKQYIAKTECKCGGCYER
jgi:hypothetical protein